jgi:AraC-like DNA-binding protein
LQRRLQLCGSSYSQILQEARFALACQHLDDPDLKVIDVAMMAGYESPQHFTRAFRRFTGITPSEYRHHGFQDDALATQAFYSFGKELGAR